MLYMLCMSYVVYVVYVICCICCVCHMLYMFCMSYSTICSSRTQSCHELNHTTDSIMPRTRSCHELDHIWNLRTSAIISYMLCNTIFSSRTRSCHELDHITNVRCSAAMLCVSMLCVSNNRVCELKMVMKKTFIYECVKIWRSSCWYQDNWVLDMFYDWVRDMSYDRICGMS